VEGIELRLLN